MSSTEQKSLPVIKQNVDGALNSRSAALIMAGAIIRGLCLQGFFTYMQHSQEYLLVLTSSSTVESKLFSEHTHASPNYNHRQPLIGGEANQQGPEGTRISRHPGSAFSRKCT